MLRVSVASDSYCYCETHLLVLCNMQASRVKWDSVMENEDRTRMIQAVLELLDITNTWNGVSRCFH